MKYQVANKEAQTVGFILALLAGFAAITAICIPYWVQSVEEDNDVDKETVRLGLWKVCREDSDGEFCESYKINVFEAVPEIIQVSFLPPRCRDLKF